MTPFEAQTLRYVHDAATGESLNLGLVMRASAAGFLQVRFLQSQRRITAAFPGADYAWIRRVAKALARAAARAAAHNAPSILVTELPSPRALVETVLPPSDSGILLGEQVHGMTSNPKEEFDRLFRELVAAEEAVAVVDDHLVGDREVWDRFVELIPDFSVRDRLETRALEARDASGFSLKLHAWRNGKINGILPLSLDLRSEDTIRTRVALVNMELHAVRPSQQNTDVFVVTYLPSGDRAPELLRTALASRDLLKESVGGEATVVDIREANELAERVSRDVLDHVDEPLLLGP